MATYTDYPKHPNRPTTEEWELMTEKQKQIDNLIEMGRSRERTDIVLKISSMIDQERAIGKYDRASAMLDIMLKIVG